MTVPTPLMQGKKGLIMGIANDRSLAWGIAQTGVVASPKASSVTHVQQTLAAEQVVLSEAELRLIDSRFPAPKRKTRLSMI